MKCNHQLIHCSGNSFLNYLFSYPDTINTTKLKLKFNHSFRMELEGEKKDGKVMKSSSRLPSPPSPESLSGDIKHGGDKMTTKTKPGGWKSMPFILGTDTFERLGSFGLTANFTVFLLNVFHLNIVSASNMLNIWSSISNFTPLIGAFISDAYIGKFWTIAIASFAQFLGMVTMTTIVSRPGMLPPPCTVGSPQCEGPTRSQLGYLIMGMGFLSIGTGGIRPCSIPFGVDQFDSTTPEGRKGITSFFNWYYMSMTVVLIICLTVAVYIQENVSWVIGFGIPTGLMVIGIGLFFLGMRRYVRVKPEGSVFSSVARVLVAAYRKRRVRLPEDGAAAGVYYDPPLPPGSTKLPLTKDYGFLSKAAVVMDGDVTGDGKCRNRWRLCSIQETEEVKCIARVIPIWPAGIACSLAIVQQITFTVNQARQMNRHLGRRFQIPAGSLFVVSLLTISLWLPFYDRVLVPWARKRTRIIGGITILQRMGIGLGFSILAMAVAGSVEIKRRAAANGGAPPLSVAWLFPQLMVMGFAEAFNILGQIEFYNKEFPENMISIGNSLTSVTWGVAGYVSTILVNTVHKTTGVHGRPDWLNDDINAGRLENFYFVIAGMGAVNLVYFVLVARRYRYKSKVWVDDDDENGDNGDLKV
ncbi:PREDICTED: protein NRT1/ PTR FAMILY 2.13-like [Ipomoea nil]|uniref:protein NRT1/ PTR FAMILY 2.13-like n=1 Tax=Ipomoea nil TaxID=35883 RepID=UPI000900F506|nr:PREDICTED: protein NRT1/ PTR FAMILY 2.13-like [Ipomoea nil]